MNLPPQVVEALLDDLRLDLEAMCRLAGVSEPWLRERWAQGLLVVGPPEPLETVYFGAAELRRARRLAGLERDFDAAPELAAMVADLEDELAALRARLRRLGVD
jgi:chaperone modulatory protein CbpM